MTAEPIPDAKQLRWRLFASRAFRPVALLVPLGVLALGAVGGEFLGGLAWAGIVLAVFWIQAARKATGGARDAFYESYAETRDLEQSQMKELPPNTLLLRQGDDRYAERAFTGELPGEIQGTLALFAFEDHSETATEVKTTPFPYTVVLHELSQVSPRLTELYCVPRIGARLTDPVRDRLTHLKRLELESEVLDKRYEIFFSPGDDEVWLKRVFVPSFIVWVESEPPQGYYFEVLGRHLSAYVRGHYQSAAQLDKLCEAAAGVAERLTGEASEGWG